MKVIGRAGGVVASREAPEEYIPDRPPPTQDIVNLIRATYQFVNFPILQPNFNANGPFIFAAGRFIQDDQAFAITQLMMLVDGDIVGTTSTDDSELVLDDLMRVLDETLGFRLRQANTKRSYVSTIVVEFDKSFSAYIDKIEKMENVINGMLPPEIEQRWFKAISFGREDMPETIVTSQITLMENVDFTIERRTGQPRSSNRFYCTAPMRTADHIRALEQIEAIARG
jgi:hypothetical protein